MKASNICPKCKSTDILRIEGRVGAYGTGNNVLAGATYFSAVKVQRYLCCSCGYSEEWIDREDLPKVKTYYKGRIASAEKVRGNY